MATDKPMTQFQHRIVLRMIALQGGDPNQDRIVDMNSNKRYLSLQERASLEKEYGSPTYEAKVVSVSTFTR